MEPETKAEHRFHGNSGQCKLQGDLQGVGGATQTGLAAPTAPLFAPPLTVVAGAVAAGDPVMVLPCGLTSTVTGVFHHGHEVAAAAAGESVLLTLAGDLDISRGDFLVAPEAPPRGVREATVTLCWMANTPLELHRKYLVRHATRMLAARVRELHAVIDVDTLDKRAPDGPLGANEIAEAVIEFAEVFHFDPYTANRAMGSFILIDGASNATLAGGLIEPGVY